MQSKTISGFTRRKGHLPHLQLPHSAYFVTFRTENRRILSPESRTLVMNAFRHFDGIRYRLYQLMVLPDHVHNIVQPLEQWKGEYFDLSFILKSLKGFTGKKINELERTPNSQVWQQESYDRIIRDKDEYEKFFNYIAQNATKDRLATKIEDYPWYYVAAGV